ncbi:hypothetical protein, partial [Streptomyces sp. NPDC001811]
MAADAGRHGLGVTFHARTITVWSLSATERDPHAKVTTVHPFWWCDRLVRGLDQHEFDVYALSRGPHQEAEG